MKFYIKILCHLFLFYFPVLAADYSVDVFVRDAGSQVGLEGALVEYVVGSDTTRFVTDVDGRVFGAVTPVRGFSDVVPLDYSLRVFPSVVDRGGLVTAEVSGLADDLRVFNVLGQDVSDRLSGLSAGLYIVSAVCGGERFAQKVFAGGGFSLEEKLASFPVRSSLSKPVVGASVRVSKGGYESFESSVSLDDAVTNYFVFDLERVPDPFVVSGVTTDELGSVVLSGGEWHYRVVGSGDEFVAPVASDGRYRVSLPVESGGLVDVWFDGHLDYDESNTFSFVKKDRPATVGVTATHVGAWNYFLGLDRDTLRVVVDSLAYPQGHYALVMSDSTASNQSVLDILDGSGRNFGVRKWVFEDVRFWCRTTYKNTSTTISSSDLSKQRRGIAFFTGADSSYPEYSNKFVTPLGVVLAGVSVEEGAGHPADYKQGRCVVQHDNDSGTPYNYQYIDIGAPFDVLGSLASVRTGNNITYVVSEIKESFGSWDYLPFGGSGTYNFTYDDDWGPADFSVIGYQVWVPTWTYLQQDFMKPE